MHSAQTTLYVVYNGIYKVMHYLHRTPTQTMPAPEPHRAEPAAHPARPSPAGLLCRAKTLRRPACALLQVPLITMALPTGLKHTGRSPYRAALVLWPGSQVSLQQTSFMLTFFFDVPWTYLGPWLQN